MQRLTCFSHILSLCSSPLKHSEIPWKTFPGCFAQNSLSPYFWLSHTALVYSVVLLQQVLLKNRDSSSFKSSFHSTICKATSTRLLKPSKVSLPLFFFPHLEHSCRFLGQLKYVAFEEYPQRYTFIRINLRVTAFPSDPSATKPHPECHCPQAAELRWKHFCWEAFVPRQVHWAHLCPVTLPGHSCKTRLGLCADGILPVTTPTCRIFLSSFKNHLLCVVTINILCLCEAAFAVNVPAWYITSDVCTQSLHTTWWGCRPIFQPAPCSP